MQRPHPSQHYRPIHYLHPADVSHARHRLLGYVMAFIGGAINAGGFFAVARYTSHMSGELARMADNIYLQDWRVVLVSGLMVISFIMGACHAAFSILWAKYARFRSSYALTLWVEALYMLLFGGMAAALSTYPTMLPVTLTVLLMCFIMGMHNTVMTMLSGGVIRSTHMTGFVTDIGIEVAKWLFASMQAKRFTLHSVQVSKLKLCVGLVVSFVLGGILGAWGFHQIQYRFVWPLSLLLLLIGLSSIVYEVRLRKRLWQRHRLKK